MIKQLGRFSRTYRSLFRYREIVGVLIKFGFGDLVQVLGLDKYLELSAQFFSGKAGNRQPYSRWDRVRMVFEELGPTFEKLGQVLSTRPDFVPEGLIVQLEKLQSSIPPFPADEARCVLETSLGKPITEVFRSFSDECIASASIAQVHQAVLPNGEVLALKIQRPGIAKVIDLDLQILNHIATLMEKHIPEMRPFNLVAVVEEFGKTIRKELDFNQEANNLYRFDNNFKGHKDIYVPKLYRQYSSTKVLAMEFVQGIMLSDTAQVLASGMDMERMATKGANLVLIQIFDHGFFHADPHPGNLMLMHDGRFCFLDFGMMGNLIPKYRRL